MRTSGGIIVEGVIDGQNGNDGNNGYNVATVPLYRRSETVLGNNDRPTGTLTYNFTSGKLTGTNANFNGWSQNVPANSPGTKLYITMATARSQEYTDEIESHEWATPVEYVADGLSNAPVLIYKRASSIGSNDKPANGCVYTFATGALSGTLNGWSTQIPAHDGNPCWVRQATAVSNTATDVIDAVEWSAAQKLVEDGVNGTSPWMADLSNEMASIACNLNGNPNSTQNVSTKISLFHGQNVKTFGTPTVKRNGTAYTVNASQYTNGVKVAYSNGTVTIYYSIDAVISTVDVFTISIVASDDNSITKDLEFYVNGVRPGANGEAATIYNLVPSVSEIVYTKSGTYSPDSMSCYCTSLKNGVATDNPSAATMQYSYNGSSWTNFSSSTTFQSATIRSNGGKLYLRLLVDSKVMDKETISVMQDGNDGDKGYSIALTLVRNNLYTDANWNTYAEIGHNENFIKRTGDSDLTACRVGDYFVVTGTSSDSGKNHTAIYKCTSVASDKIYGDCVSHTQDGEKGDDAVTYQIVFTEAWAKVDASNNITARLRGNAYKIEGSTRTALSNATIRIGYILTNSNTYVEITANSSGYFTEDNWFNGDQYGSSGYSQGSQVIFAAIIINSAVKCVEYVTMTLAGAKGDTGRMYYIAGEFPKKAPYTRTDKLCPVVYYGGEWWYLDAASATGSDTPSDSSSKWKKLQNYGVVLTDAIFVKNFAQFGAAIITGDWLISIHGMIGNTYYGGSIENPDEYNNRAAYTYFDPAYPWGYDPFQLPVINEEVTTDQYHSWTRLTNNFKLPAGTYTFNISCYVNSSDNMHLRLFNGDESSDALYLGGTQSDELVTLTYTKTLTSSQYWNVRATMNAAGENGYVVAVEVVPTDARFIPNYAVDLRTGKTYQSDAHIKGAIQCIGPTSKITIEDGVIRMYGAMNFPNIVLGVNEDGCAVLNFYDKNGNFKYGLGPDEIFRTKSQAESMTLKYYNVDAGSEDCTSLLNSEVVMLYLYMFKNQITNALTTGSLYKYLAKISAGQYGPGSYCASIADAQKYNEKIIKYGYSMSAKLKDSDVYSGGGIVVTSSRTTCGIINRLSNMLNGESVDDLDYRGYNVMQDSDFNKTKEGSTYYFRTKDTYNPVQAFYWDSSYPSSSPGGVGYENAYSDKYWLNLCTNPADDETLIDPVYYFNLMCIDSNGTNKGFKTLYINRKKLQTILQNAGYSL